MKSDFNKFISLWISFNAFYSNYSQKDTEELDIKKIVEDFQTDFITRKNEKSIKEFYDYINNRKVYGFENVNKWLLNLYCYNKNDSNIREYNTEEQLLQSNKFEISNEYNGIKLKDKNGARNMLIWYYDNQEELKWFLFVLYQIRCNLFHWWKDPSEEADKIVMKNAVVALKIFLENLYIKENVL